MIVKIGFPCVSADVTSIVLCHQVTFTLLDQVNKHHVSAAFHPLESSSSFQRPVNETNVASGLPQFFPLNLLHAETTYLYNDTLAIRATIDTKI